MFVSIVYAPLNWISATAKRLATMDIALYESGGNRSARVRWTALECGIAYENAGGTELIGSDDLKTVHPLAKLPAAMIDGKPLFESAAICTYLADHAPDANLIAAPGSWGRAEHDQWVAFILTEMEAWLWNTGVNSYVLPEEQRITAGFEQNDMMFRRSAMVLDEAMADRDYIVENRFTVTDIIVGWTVNWGRRTGNLDGMLHLSSYLDRLFARPHCALNPD